MVHDLSHNLWAEPRQHSFWSQSGMCQTDSTQHSCMGYENILVIKLYYLYNQRLRYEITEVNNARVTLPNISLMSLALSPIYLSTIALDTTWVRTHFQFCLIRFFDIIQITKCGTIFGCLTLRKLASSWLATARASNVFPVPGKIQQVNQH